MTLSSIIIVSVLLVANVTLIVSEVLKFRNKKKEIAELRKKKEAEMVHRSGADSLETLTDDDLEDEIEPKQCHVWILGIVICLDIWIVGAIVTHLWAAHYFTDVPAGDSRKALFGDSFGAVNALVSALAFAGMIVAFVLQRYELRLQRKELRDSRKEMKQQTAQFEAENKNLEIQRFENLFYNMLNLQQKIVDGLRYDYYDEENVTVALDGGGTANDRRMIKREVVGRDVFRYLFNEVPLSVKVDGGKKIVHGYRWFLSYEGYVNYDTTLIPSYFDHYFRHLYKIVQFVDSQGFEYDDAYRYLSFLRGTLSRYELVWLYYNALYPDFYKFKLLIEKYSLLKALRSDLLTITKETADFYDSRCITREDLENSQFGVNDFAFYLTEDETEEDKYQISAFWNNRDFEGGKRYINGWKQFISKKDKEI